MTAGRGPSEGSATAVAVNTPTQVAPGRSGPLHIIGNILWFLLAGFWLAVGHVLTGLLLCFTIIGIPFGVASFKLAGLALTPFGKAVVRAGAPLPPEARVYLAL